jgi:hypothetical protein
VTRRVRTPLPVAAIGDRDLSSILSPALKQYLRRMPEELHRGLGTVPRAGRRQKFLKCLSPQVGQREREISVMLTRQRQVHNGSAKALVVPHSTT